MSIKIGENLEYFLDLLRRYYRDSVSGTVLGTFLIFLQPVLIVTFLTFLFHKGFRGSFLVEEIAVITLSLSLWLYFVMSVTTALTSFRTYRYALYKRGLSKFLLPLVPVTGNLPILAVNLTFCTTMSVLGGATLSSEVICSFVGITMMLIIITGSIAISTAYISAFINDFRFLVGSILQIFFWMSPILWDSGQIGDSARSYLSLNPFFPIADFVRSIFGDAGSLRYGPASAHLIAWLSLAVLVHRKLKSYVGEEL